MTPPAPGSGPGHNTPAPRRIDTSQIGKLVLALMGLRSPERDLAIAPLVQPFQTSSDAVLRAHKVNIAEDVFGRVTYDAVIAARSSRKNAAHILLSLGKEIDGYFLPGGGDRVELRAARAMARMARRKLGVLTPGSDAEEREDLAAFTALKRWLEEARDTRLAYLEDKIRKAFKTSPGSNRPWNIAPKSPPPPPAPWALSATGMPVSAPEATLLAAEPSETPTGHQMTTQPDPAHLPAQPDTQTPAVSPAPSAAPKNRASAWKFLDVPLDEPDRHSYLEALEGHHRSPQGLPIVAARVRGKKHKHEGTNGDDAFDIGFAGKWSILAVSDGAGSCRFSRVGAQASCDAAVDVLTKYLTDVPLETLDIADTARDPVTYRFAGELLNKASQGLHQAMQAAYQAIEAETQKRLTADYDKILGRHIEIKDLSCTLLLAIHIPVLCQGKKYDWVMGCQIGDGMIAAVTEAGSLVLLATPDTGAFSGETDFITSKNKLEPSVLWSKTRAGLINMRALMAMTDGVADDYFPNDPGMLRLFGDLCLNGVVQFEQPSGVSPTAPSPEAISSVVERLTGVDTSEDVRIFSLESCAKAMGKTVDQIMKEPHENLAAAAGIANPAESGSERLALWLDSYQVRGSFDDRALAMIYSTDATKESQ